jgi:glucose/arabinose dehydrogenase
MTAKAGGARAAAALAAAILCGSHAVRPAHAVPTKQAAASGYALTQVQLGTNVAPADINDIAQIQFGPGPDPARTYLYAARVSAGAITRYEYTLNPATNVATLSNDVNVLQSLSPATANGNLRAAASVDAANQFMAPYGLAFHGTDLYVTVNPSIGASRQSRIGRVQMDASGGYSNPLRYFTYNLANGNFHGTNQLQVRGNGLYVGVGVFGQYYTGAERPWNGTVSRIADVTQIDLRDSNTDRIADTNHRGDFGPGGYSGPDAANNVRYLRKFADGLRNPFGIRFDSSGSLWATDNGGDPVDGLPLTNDLLYRNLTAGQRGVYPTFPTDDPGDYVTAHNQATVHPIKHLGQHTGSTGLDFITNGPHAGMTLVARYGSAFPDAFPNGYDVVLVDPSTQAPASHPVTTSRDDSLAFVTGFGSTATESGPTDIIRDPAGSRFLINNYADDRLYLLTTPLDGDANLDGSVNGSDFALLAGNFGRTGRAWGEGDFNDDGSVNGTDFALLAGNFGRNLAGAGASVDAADWAALESFGAEAGVPVPEPGTAAGISCVLMGGLLSRRAGRRRPPPKG